MHSRSPRYGVICFFPLFLFIFSQSKCYPSVRADQKRSQSLLIVVIRQRKGWIKRWINGQTDR